MRKVLVFAAVVGLMCLTGRAAGAATAAATGRMTWGSGAVEAAKGWLIALVCLAVVLAVRYVRRRLRRRG